MGEPEPVRLPEDPGTEQLEIPNRITHAAALTIDHRQFCDFLDLAGLQHYSKAQYFRVAARLGDVIEEKVTRSMRRAREKAKEASAKKGRSGLSVAVDCRWSSRGWNAEEATITMIDLDTGAIIYLVHVLRQRGPPTTIADPAAPYRSATETTLQGYIGTSRGMEGAGFRRVRSVCFGFLRHCKPGGCRFAPS